MFFVGFCYRLFIFTVYYNDLGRRDLKNIKQKLTFGTEALCFTMIFDAFLLKSCSKAAPAALGGCGGLGQLWEALAELWEALGELWEALCCFLK